jgi:hypothetical protein
MSARHAASSSNCSEDTWRPCHGRRKYHASRLRHRDRLLSQTSTIEACFSVPMLNITLPSFLVLAFAVQGLGWSPARLANGGFTPPGVSARSLALLSRKFSAYGLLLLTFSWAPSLDLGADLPTLGPARDIVFTAILVIATCSCSIASVACPRQFLSWFLNDSGPPLRVATWCSAPGRCRPF